MLVLLDASRPLHEHLGRSDWSRDADRRFGAMPRMAIVTCACGVRKRCSGARHGGCGFPSQLGLSARLVPIGPDVIVMAVRYTRSVNMGNVRATGAGAGPIRMGVSF